MSTHSLRYRSLAIKHSFTTFKFHEDMSYQSLICLTTAGDKQPGFPNSLLFDYHTNRQNPIFPLYLQGEEVGSNPQQGATL